jgi:hypothetical protein
MKLIINSPVKSLSKAYLKQSLKREQIELFKANLARMFERIRTDEHEEHLKNIVSDFLKDTWYKQTNEINTSGRTDLVIHNGKSSSDTVGVLMEVKRPGNNNEMISPERPNAKALHELLHYYMQERYVKGNMEVRRLIVCNIHEWYVFDASDFERLFFNNRKFVENYQKWSEGLFSGEKTDWLYREILKPFVENELESLPCTYFNLKDYARFTRRQDEEDDKKLIALYKVLSPLHLLKQTFANDTNSLNREFYNELLHIIGLEEVKEKGKKLINRKAPERQDEASLLENTINILKVRNKLAAFENPEQFGATEDEQYFSLGLELCITWLNRILFLKLLEGQLLAYHRGNRDFAFLNAQRIADFDEMEELFFEVLARRNSVRSGSVQIKFGDIPYLNSSLFEESDLERTTIHIAALKGRLDLELHGATVLKDSSGKRLTGKKNTLQYLFEFLDAYDFSSEGEAEIQENPRSIINASVLGLIFEKINGYRDGSFYTPGFITMYICRETIRRAVVERFCHAGEPGFQKLAGFDELRDRLDASDREVRKRANAILNNLTICDPAVGSGHFLVSALNEMIAVKSELGILSYRDNGDRIKEYRILVENDELIVTDKDDDNFFAYTLNRNDKPIDELQRLQETLFHEKETIIENCLFGVDINPKSVAICRLRLWIELLKSAYYTRESAYAELETLPNIDINIKCGNSLVSRFAVSGGAKVAPADKKKLKELTEKYRRYVTDYKLSTPTTATKGYLRRFIDDLKHDLEKFGTPTDKDMFELRRKENFLDQLPLFAPSKKEAAERKKFQDDVDSLKKRLDIKQRTVYANAFEWRFEFPEVLDENGEFSGFDAIIGNPPYGVSLQKELKQFYQTFSLRGESYVLFVEKGHELLRVGGQFCFIMPDTYLSLSFTAALRDYLLKNSQLFEVVALPAKVFEEAVVDTTLLFTSKAATSPTFHDGKVRIKSFAKQAIEINLDAPDRLESVEINQWHESGTFNLLGDAATAALLGRLDQTYRKIEFVSEMFSGIKAYEVGKGKPPQTEVIRDGKPFTAATRLHDGFLPFYDGKHVGRYSLLWQENNWLHYGPWLAAPRNPDNFIGEKVLIRKIVGETLIATYVPDTSYCNTLLHVLKLKPEAALSYLYLLGILNSRFIGWYYRAKFQISADDTFPQIMISDIQQFPVPDVSPEKQAPIVALVERILAAKKVPPPPTRGGQELGEAALTDIVDNSTVTHPPTPSRQGRGGETPIDIPALEAEIDRLVYALYGLTDEEIDVVEGKK